MRHASEPVARTASARTRRWWSRLSLIALAALAGNAAWAVPIAVIGYDIEHATASGFGGWSHAYSGGSIAPVRNFTNGIGGPPGTVANYAGGIGTLNDGVVGTMISDTQLFVQGNVDGGGEIRPVIKLKLASAAMISSIKLAGGNIDFNLFPGQISGVTIEFGGAAAAVTTTPSGLPGVFGDPVDDIANLAGTPLAALTTDTIVLRDFVFAPITFNQFSITEISVEGTLSPPAATRVEIDVKPGGPYNIINLQAGPRVRVAVLSSSTFDARTVNPWTLTFGKTGEEPSLLSCQAPRDVSGDRRPDLVCVFSISATGLTEGRSMAALKGRTQSGAALYGTDKVRVRSRYAAGEIDDHTQDD